MAEQTVMQFPKWSKVFFGPARYKVCYGGRGGGRSWTFARMALIRAAQAPLRVLCAREFQSSIRDSVYHLLRAQIPLLGLQGQYMVGESYIRSITGSEFLFKGLRYNTTEIQSFEDADICWVEEARAVSEQSWRILLPTIRAPGSEIWIGFNPELETDPVYQRFVLRPPPNAVVVKASWRDNPWFPQELEDQRKHDKANLPSEDYDHIWEGTLWNQSEACVLHGKWVSEAFEPQNDWYGPYYGADWGYSNDPMAIIKFYITPGDESLMIEDEVYGTGIEMDEYEEKFNSIVVDRKSTIRADSARPDCISHVRRKRFKIIGARKKEGAIKSGIGWFRSRPRIVIHPRCKGTINEAKLWQWKRDRITDDILPVLVPGNDNSWDAIRYGAELAIRYHTQKAMGHKHQTAEQRIF